MVFVVVVFVVIVLVFVVFLLLLLFLGHSGTCEADVDEGWEWRRVNHGQNPVFSRGDAPSLLLRFSNEQVTELGRTMIFTKLPFLRRSFFR